MFYSGCQNWSGPSLWYIFRKRLASSARYSTHFSEFSSDIQHKKDMFLCSKYYHILWPRQQFTINQTLFYTDKKENKIFPIYREFQIGSGAKWYMRKGFLIYEKSQIFLPYMRTSLVIYDFAPDPSEFPNIGGKFSLLFISVMLFYVDYRRSSVLLQRLQMTAENRHSLRDPSRIFFNGFLGNFS